MNSVMKCMADFVLRLVCRHYLYTGLSLLALCSVLLSCTARSQGLAAVVGRGLDSHIAAEVHSLSLSQVLYGVEVFYGASALWEPARLDEWRRLVRFISVSSFKSPSANKGNTVQIQVDLSHMGTMVSTDVNYPARGLADLAQLGHKLTLGCLLPLNSWLRQVYGLDYNPIYDVKVRFVRAENNEPPEVLLGIRTSLSGGIQIGSINENEFAGLKISTKPEGIEIFSDDVEVDPIIIDFSDYRWIFEVASLKMRSPELIENWDILRPLW